MWRGARLPVFGASRRPTAGSWPRDPPWAIRFRPRSGPERSVGPRSRPAEPGPDSPRPTRDGRHPAHGLRGPPAKPAGRSERVYEEGPSGGSNAAERREAHRSLRRIRWASPRGIEARPTLRRSGGLLVHPLTRRDHWRRARNPKGLPRLTIERVRAWAKAHRSATESWPTDRSGPVAGAPAPGETWARIHNALRSGHRGLPGGLTLSRVLRSAGPDGNGSAPGEMTDSEIGTEFGKMYR